MRILFVCTGNTCRSPMAEYLTRKKVAERGLNFQIQSAGLFAAPGLNMSPHALHVLSQQGISGDPHESQIVQSALIEQADIVFTMTRRHQEELLHRFPEFSYKIHQLGMFAADASLPFQDSYDIVDPFGGTEADYAKCLELLDQVIDLALDKLQDSGQSWQNEVNS